MPKTKLFSLRITTPAGDLFDQKVQFVKLTAPSGDIGLRAKHENAILQVLQGDIRVQTETDDMLFTTSGGVLYLQDEQAVLLAPFAAKADEYEKKRSNYLRKLEQRYSDELKSEADLHRIQMAMRRSLTQQQ